YFNQRRAGRRRRAARRICHGRDNRSARARFDRQYSLARRSVAPTTYLHYLMQRTHIRKRNLRSLDRLGYMIATGFGAGSAPVAPGTFGAAEGVVLFLIINA